MDIQKLKISNSLGLVMSQKLFLEKMEDYYINLEPAFPQQKRKSLLNHGDKFASILYHTKN